MSDGSVLDDHGGVCQTAPHTEAQAPQRDQASRLSRGQGDAAAGGRREGAGRRRGWRRKGGDSNVVHADGFALIEVAYW